MSALDPSKTLEVAAMGLLADARAGNDSAKRKLHACIAYALENDALTPALRSLVAELHDAAARGEPMVLRRKGRSPESERDLEVWTFIFGARFQWRVGYAAAKREYKRHEFKATHGPLPTLKALYAQAARKYGISEDRAKSIYLAQRKRIEKQGV